MDQLRTKLLVWLVSVLVILEGYKIKGCLQNERDALLQIKSYFSSVPSDSPLQFPTWEVRDGQSDCCKWEGVKCSPYTGHVTHLFLGYAVTPRHVWTLNMTLFHPFQELSTLDLSDNWIGSLVQSEGRGNLKNSLQSLDLSYNQFQSLPDILWNLSSLRVLDISNGILARKLDARVCQLSNIREFYLANAVQGLNGSVPDCVSNLTSLQVLDLRYNGFSGNLPSLVNLPSLEWFSIQGNHFHGKFSLSTLANHSSLQVLLLSNNALQVEIGGSSLSLSTLQLHVLGLANCNLSVHTKTLQKLLSFQSNLQYIDLSNNRLVGSFPNWLLQNNSGLVVYNLRNNLLTGRLEIPKFGNQSLRLLDISSNQLSGEIPRHMGMTWPALQMLQMSDNSFQGQIPNAICNMTLLELLDLSNNKFLEEVPKNLFTDCYMLGFLALSNNSLDGEIIPSNTRLSELDVLCLDGNRFTGAIDESLMNSTSLTYLDVSNNNAIGELPRWIGNLSELRLMSLARNQFHGSIPSQICNLESLRYLDLSENRFVGEIPSCGCPSQLSDLHLHGNSLTGPVPKGLQRCSNQLRVLNVANNQLSGGIPRWIPKLSNLIILLLGDNQLQGELPTQVCQLQHLNIFDASNNSISGAIPSCLQNLSFGAFESNSVGFGIAFGLIDEEGTSEFKSHDTFHNVPSRSVDPSEQVDFIVKSRYASYKGEMIGIMSLLDLSCNQFSGYIPPELGELKTLNTLNMSHNYLSGPIPGSFSKLKSIESLDLSWNKLSGTIPSQLVDLNFLEVFNVSYNNLSGRVPETEQFGSYDESNYLGNPLLCGSQLSNKCSPKEPPSSSPPVELEDEGDDAFDLEVFLCSFGVSLIFALFTIFMVLYINANWRRAWFAFIDYHILWWLY